MVKVPCSGKTVISSKLSAHTFSGVPRKKGKLLDSANRVFSRNKKGSGVTMLQLKGHLDHHFIGQINLATRSTAAEFRAGKKNGDRVRTPTNPLWRGHLLSREIS